MGFEGTITYLSVAVEDVAWSETVRFRSSKELECRVREFRGCRMVAEGDEFVLLDAESDQSSEVSRNEGRVEDGNPIERSWLRFDTDASDIKSLKCAIIGRKPTSYTYDTGSDEDCYVIIAKSGGNCDGIFERVGVGSIDSKYISLVGPGIKAILI
jgi:hypothetical protein